MFNFSQPSLSDVEWLKDVLKYSQPTSCEYAIGNLLGWCSHYGARIAKVEDCLVAKIEKNELFGFPKGKDENIENALNAIKSNYEFPSFYGLTYDEKEMIERLYPGEYNTLPSRNNFDYIYKVKDLAELKGKKYHSKRNHIAYFQKTYNWTYEEITDKNLQECIEMNEKWYELNVEKDKTGIETEKEVLDLLFKYYFDMNFRGGLLRVDGQAVAFTFGEELNKETFDTHFEKAFASFRGAYPMINMLFAQNTISDYEFVNREDDVGSEGLRKAKLSYHPYTMIEKIYGGEDLTELIDVNLYRKEIISLWQQCFSDKEEYIAFFLDNCAEFSCLGYRLDGKLVSMLFLLDSEIDGFKCSYLYAACTDGAHRGKGIMGRLIEFAKQVSISSGCSGIFLVPAEESLYGYYSRFNFESCFTKKSFSFELNRCEKYGDRVPDETDVKKIFDMRRELLSSLCRFSLSEKNSYYAIKEHFFNDGKIKYINSNGLKLLAFYYFDGKNILIKELLSNKSVEKLTIDELFINYNPENVYIFCPIVYNIMDNLAEYTKCGMCCPLNDEFKVYINSNSDFYAGIYLD